MYQRNLLEKVRESVRFSPATLINGSRQTGKSTFIQNTFVGIRRQFPGWYGRLARGFDVGLTMKLNRYWYEPRPSGSARGCRRGRQSRRLAPQVMQN